MFGLFGFFMWMRYFSWSGGDQPAPHQGSGH